jgi:glycosyltransferase involved in cell wall biosynthesis
MRILHIGKYYAPERGGIESTMQALGEWTAAHDHAVTALVHQRPGVWRTTRETIGGVDVRRVACIGAPLYTPLSPTFPLALAHTLRDAKPDVLHLHMPNPSCFAALVNPAAKRARWLVHWHSDIPPDAPDWRLRVAYRAYRPFEQALLKRAHAIVTTSRAYLDASSALAPWRDKAHVIALGCGDSAPVPARQDLWPVGDGLRVLAVGRMSRYKGFEVLLDAIAQASDARLLLIGEGECAAELRDRVATLRLEDRVRFAGAVDDDTLLGAYAAADVFVLPSLNRGEAFGLVLLEAMRAGVPVIASAIAGSGIGDVVADGETGLLVAPGDADALADALARMRDADLRRRLGNDGRRRWLEHFTLEQSARRWLSLYEAQLH